MINDIDQATDILADIGYVDILVPKTISDVGLYKTLVIEVFKTKLEKRFPMETLQECTLLFSDIVDFGDLNACRLFLQDSRMIPVNADWFSFYSAQHIEGVMKIDYVDPKRKLDTDPLNPESLFGD